MSILQMSFSASIMILVVIVIRALAINKLPKKTFIALWAIVLARLVIPFSFPSPFSVYSIISNHMATTEQMAGTPAAYILPFQAYTQLPTDELAGASSPITSTIPLWMVLWIAGIVICGLFFTVSYIKYCIEFKTSLPVKNNVIDAWLADHKTIRPITVRQSDRISAPLTYGIFHPVILISQKTDLTNEKQLQYILTHEYVHIRHFDAVTKLFLTFALCIHWFNPLVWAMYILSNRDIELSCDEAVVRHFGESLKSSYALTLVSMEEKKSGLSPLYNNFSKNAIEERITAIMKIKKTSLIAGFLAIALIFGVTTVFATSAATAHPNFSNYKDFPNNTPNTESTGSPLSEIKIGDNYFKPDSDKTVSTNKNITFDIQSIMAGENVQLGGYALQKDDTVQVQYENSGNKISVFISTGNGSSNLQSARTEIPIGTVHKIQQDGEYYFHIQNNATNGASNIIKGTIQLNYHTPQMVQNERIQFTDDEVPNENQSVNNAKVPDVETENNKSPYDGMFDDELNVLQYFNKGSYVAESYKENVGDNKAVLAFSNFSGMKTIYELNFSQTTTVDFGINADVNGEYKIAFITENSEVVMKASTYNWLPASRPIELPKGKTTIVLIGEQATGNCEITLDY